jgi:hypothetical protein
VSTKLDVDGRSDGIFANERPVKTCSADLIAEASSR